MAAESKRKFGDFSDDELHLIFNCLLFRDRLNVALVCKQWHCVANQSRFLRDFYVVFRDQPFSQMTRKFQCLKFTRKLSQREQQLLEGLGSQVVELVFKDCCFKRPLRLDSFSALATLQLDVGENIAFSFSEEATLLRLTFLSILCTRMSDDQFKMLCDHTPNLKRLQVDSYDSQTVNDNNWLVSPAAVLYCLRTRSATLTSLECNNIGPSTLNAIANVPGLNLQKFVLLQNFDSDESFLPAMESLSLSQSNLISLSFSFLSDDDINTICTHLLGLQTLYLEDCGKLTNAVIAQLFGLRELKRLALRALEVAGFDQFLKERSSLNLVSLDLTDCYSLRDRDVCSICDRFPDLQDLCLDGCSLLGDLSAYRVFQMQKLRRLGLGMCTSVSEEGMSTSLEYSCCHLLKELNVCHCHINDGFVEIACVRFKDLRNMCISSCAGITERSVQVLSQAGVSRDLTCSRDWFENY